MLANIEQTSSNWHMYFEYICWTFARLCKRGITLLVIWLERKDIRLIEKQWHGRMASFCWKEWSADSTVDFVRQEVLICCAGFQFSSAKKVMFLLVFVCLCVCVQDNSKSYGRIFLKFWGYVGHGISYKWLNFGLIRQESWILDHFEIFVTIALNGA